MFDTHYDLLTVAYKAYLENDFRYLENWCKAYNENNVLGVIANLYFTSEEEMTKEINPNYYQKNVSVVEMFKIAKDIIEIYLPDTKIIYSIEGCNYLEISELDKLYELGLRNILPVWNRKNKYASGNRSNDGLTNEGKKLIDKLIELGISIDLSHTNEKSFNDILDYIEIKDEKPLIMASHSNCRSLCNRDRNLYDYQLKRLKEVDGLVGIFSNRNFIVPNEIKDSITSNEKRKKYIEHINHCVEILGLDNVVVATDDMDFCKDADIEYGNLAIYNYKNIKQELTNDLSKYYNKEEIEKILYKNMLNRYNRIINIRKEKKI